MRVLKIILRVAVSPLFLGVLTCSYCYACLGHWLSFLRYGGELVIYKKDDVKTIAKLFELLKEQNKKEDES